MPNRAGARAQQRVRDLTAVQETLRRLDGSCEGGQRASQSFAARVTNVAILERRVPNPARLEGRSQGRPRGVSRRQETQSEQQPPTGDAAQSAAPPRRTARVTCRSVSRLLRPVADLLVEVKEVGYPDMASV